MCDYSLHGVASRPAKVGDKLTSTRFHNSITRGFASIDESDVAVCLMPGTELAFEAGVEAYAMPSGELKKLGHAVARFRQIDLDHPLAHHDALEFPEGEIVLVTNLREGQMATVLQLPSAGNAVPRTEEQTTAPAHETPITSDV